MDNVDKLVFSAVFDYSPGNVARQMEEIATAEEKVVKKNKDLEKSNKKVAKSFKEVQTKGFQLGKALRTLGVYIGLKEIMKYADAWTGIRNTLSQITENDRERVALTERLYKISGKTRASMGETVSTFTSLESQGLNRSQQLNATETLNKAFKISGGNARTAETIKRILKTGKLQSLLGIDQSFAEIIAAGMNMNLEELQQKIRKGGLTSIQVLQAISNQSGEINKRFAKTKTTFSEATSRLSESFGRFVSRLDEATGSSKFVIKQIDKIAGFFDKLIDNSNILGKILLHGALGLGLTSIIRNFDLFILNLKDGIPLLKSFKLAMQGSYLSTMTKGLWAMTIPLLKIYLVMEAINQAIKLIKGEETIFDRIGEKLGNFFSTGSFNDETYQQRMERLTRQGKIGNVKPMQPITNTSSNVSNANVNQNFNITINESKQGMTTVDHLMQTSLKQAIAGGY